MLCDAIVKVVKSVLFFCVHADWVGLGTRSRSVSGLEVWASSFLAGRSDMNTLFSFSFFALSDYRLRLSFFFPSSPWLVEGLSVAGSSLAGFLPLRLDGIDGFFDFIFPCLRRPVLMSLLKVDLTRGLYA